MLFPSLGKSLQCILVLHKEAHFMLRFDIRVQTKHQFDYCRVYDTPKETKLLRFSRLIWFGYDEEGPAVYREDPKTGEVVHIDFLH
jgi:hypothetical protein